MIDDWIGFTHYGYDLHGLKDRTAIVYTNVCSECPKYQESEKGKAAAEKNKERSRQKQTEWWEKNRDKVNARRREKYAREKKE